MTAPARPGLAALLALGACQSSYPLNQPVPAEDPTAAWEARLAEVVQGDGYVLWDSLLADHAALDAYVAWLSRDGAVPEDPKAAHAFWLNAYNAWTLSGVVQAGAPYSVQAVPGYLPYPGSGFFFETTWNAGGRYVSLHHVENTELRATYQDPRDHAALNCASRSCPPLRAELYRASILDAQLDDQVRRWADDPVRGWRVEDKVLVMNPIIQWYAEDFPDGVAGSCAWWARYANEARRAQLAKYETCEPVFFLYDWRLNRP